MSIFARPFNLTLFRIALLGPILSCHIASAETLRIYNWEDYLSPTIIDEWEQQSGHKVQQLYYDNDEERDSVLVNSKEQSIDIVIADETATPIFGQKGVLVAKQTYEKTPNVWNVDEAWQPICGDHGVPYLWGTLGLAYRTDKFTKAPTSWTTILSPSKELTSHVGYLDDFIDTLSPALFVMGEDVNTENPNLLKKAFETTKAALPNILTFTYAISAMDDAKLRDQLFIAIAYSGDQYALNDKAGQEIWGYTTLEEGTVKWLDCLAVMADSPRKQIAYDFINFLYRPDIAARNSEEVYVASPMKQARAMQSKEFLEDETVYPPKNRLATSQSYRRLSPEAVVLRNRITSSLIKIHESK